MDLSPLRGLFPILISATPTPCGVGYILPPLGGLCVGQPNRKGSPETVSKILLIFVVVERLPETDPDIEQSEAAADAAEKAVSYDHPKRRE